MTTSPSAQIVAASLVTEAVVDAEGRQLLVRRMTALDRLRLFKAIGPVLSQNNSYLGMAMLASSVVMIDGVPVPAPSTEGQIEGLVAKLGDIGIAAVADILASNTPLSLGSTARETEWASRPGG